MIRHVKDDIYQIGSCLTEETGAEAVHIYVMLNDGHPILIDCGSHLHRGNLMAELDTVLAGAIPQWIFLTHTELPHSGNLQQVAEKWPDIQVKVSNVLLSCLKAVAPDHDVTEVGGGDDTYSGRSTTPCTAILA